MGRKPGNGQLTLQRLHGELVPLDEVKQFLTVETDVARVADFTRAVEAAKTIDGRNQERRDYWAELAIWSTRRLGELIRDGQKKGTIAAKKDGRRANKYVSHDAILLTLGDIGIKPDQSSRAQKIAGLPERKLQSYIDRQREQQDEISKAGLLRYAGADGTIATKHGNDVIEWYTPAEYVERARKVMGSIDLDPASTRMAQKTVKAGTFHTKDDNGLLFPWSGNVFLNPPYKQPDVAEFVGKLCKEYESGDVEQAVLLTNNNTDTDWWQIAAKTAAVICFTDGRIRFYNAAGDWSSPTNGQTFMYFGRRRKGFCSEFASVGICMEK